MPRIEVDWNQELQRFVGGQAQVSVNESDGRQLLRTNVTKIRYEGPYFRGLPEYHLEWSRALDITDPDQPRIDMTANKRVSGACYRVQPLPKGRVLIVGEDQVVIVLYPRGDVDIMVLRPPSSR